MTARLRKGFTLIELLIVIAILGTLAVVILLALNPVEQLARTRDSGRISAITQLGHALEAYATSNNGIYPPENATWITSLVNAGEIGTVPGEIRYSANGITGCTTNAPGSGSAGAGFCYDATAAAGTAPVVTFARLESRTHTSRCTSQFGAGNTAAWAFYSTALGRGGVACTGGAIPAISPGNVLP